LVKSLRKDFIILGNISPRGCPLCMGVSKENITFRCYPSKIFLTICADCIEYAYEKLRTCGKEKKSGKPIED